MLSNTQSLVLTGIMALGIFVFGILDILNNFLVLTGLTLVFFAVVINILYTKFKYKDERESLNDNNT